MEGDCEPTEAAAANASELSLVELFSNGFKIATKPLDFAKLLVATPTDIGSELTISPPWALEAKEKWKALNAQLAQTEPFSKPFAEISKEMVSVMDQASVSLDPWEIKAMYARTTGFDPELVNKLRFATRIPYLHLYKNCSYFIGDSKKDFERMDKRSGHIVTAVRSLKDAEQRTQA